MSKAYTIGIIGLGEVGREVTKSLADKMREETLPIDLVYLVTNNPSKKDFILTEDGKNGTVAEKFKCVPPQGLKDVAHRADIWLLSYELTPDYSARYANSKKNGTGPDRIECALWNLEHTRKIAQNFSKNYNGTIIVASNHSDILAQQFAMNSDIESRRVIGLSQKDTIYLKNLILKDLLADNRIESGQTSLNIFAIGRHDSPMGFYELMRINGVSSYEYSQQSQRKQAWNDQLCKYAKTSVERGVSTITDTVAATMQTIQAIMNGHDEITAGAPYKNEKWTYIGIPVHFDKMAAQLSEKHMKALANNPEFTKQAKELPESYIKAMKDIVSNKKIKDGNKEALEELVKNENRLLGEIELFEEKSETFKPKECRTIGYVRPEKKIYVITGTSGKQESAIYRLGDKNKINIPRKIQRATLMNIRDKQYFALGLRQSGNDAVEFRPLDNLEEAVFVLSTSKPFDQKQGFGSVAAIDDFVCATNYRTGAFIWDLRNPKECILNAFENMNKPRSSQKITIGNQEFFVIAGDKIRLIDPYKMKSSSFSSEEKITSCLTVFENALYAGMDKKLFSKDFNDIEHKELKNQRGIVSVPGMEFEGTPFVIDVDWYKGHRYAALGVISQMGLSNLIVKDLDEKQAPFVLPGPSEDLSKKITDVLVRNGKVFAAYEYSSKVHEFDLESRMLETTHSFENPVISIAGEK